VHHDRGEMLRTAKAMLVLALVAAGIMAVTVGVSRWDKWLSSEPRIVIQPPREHGRDASGPLNPTSTNRH
jgi:uncharacterized membrane protein YcaP (DUF421 family)